MQNFQLKIPYRYSEIIKNEMIYSIMTSLTIFIPNQNLFNFVVSQKSQQISLYPSKLMSKSA